MKWFSKLKEGLKKTSGKLTDSISKIFTHKKIDAETLEELEDILIQADLGINVTTKIIQRFEKEKVEKEATPSEIQALIADEIENTLSPHQKELSASPAKKPFVIIMAGVNGSGKTTTCAKMGWRLAEKGMRVRLAACDTFRAAAVEQLEVWAKRLNIPVSKGALNIDPASLAFDAYKAAEKEGEDVLIIDTAGRLHTNQNLMAELEKIIRVLKKIDPTLPHEVFLVLDATIGQNARVQLEAFRKTADITGLVMTKLDGTARGGVLVGLTEEFKLPIYFIGTGETKEELHPFDAKDFSKALVGLGE